MKLELTDKADLDLSEIWLYNAERYSVEHADKYQTFLIDEMKILKDRPEWGRPVHEYPNLRYLIIKWRSRGHGHAVYYEIRTDTVRVIRILHTAIHPPNYLGGT